MNKYKLRSLNGIRQDVRKIYNSMLRKYRNENEAYERLKSILIQAARSDVGLEDISETQRLAQKTANCVGFIGVLDDMFNKIEHYYIPDDNLVEFLESTEVRDPLALKSNVRQMFFVHTHHHCYLIQNAISVEGDMVVTVYKDEDWINGSPEYGAGEESFEFFLEHIKKDKTHAMAFALNLLFYMKAFPEEIISGLPEDMCKSDRSVMRQVKEKKSIGTSEKLLSFGHSVTPHFRKGFFRTFRAERYVKMKGKTIFIEGTMVRGRMAHTVKSKEEQI